jgi:hypothetical protein
MTNIRKHIGTINNTGNKVAVVFFQIPGREKDALVVDLNALPPKFENSFIDLLNQEGQRSNEKFSDLLNRRTFPDGRIMLKALHDEGYLQPVPIENISMQITNQRKMPLAEIVNAMNAPKNAQKDNVVTETVTPLADYPQQDSTLSNEELAKNLMMQVSLLESDIERMKTEAFKLDPSLKPKRRGRPSPKKD